MNVVLSEWMRKRCSVVGEVKCFGRHCGWKLGIVVCWHVWAMLAGSGFIFGFYSQIRPTSEGHCMTSVITNGMAEAGLVVDVGKQ